MRIMLGAALALAALAAPAQAEKVSECSLTGFCYCAESAVKPAVGSRVSEVRAALQAARKAGKAVGYLSAPISTVGGGYSGVNAEVAAIAKAALEKRFGADRIVLTDPNLDLPKEARGEDYMLMWTGVFEGANGLGEDFDFAYFVGPADFARYFGLTGEGDMAKIDAFFDKRMESDAGLKRAVEGGRLTRDSFRNYYALKASVAFSRGSSDEWNIVQAINERRRADKNFGVANQIAVLFAGQGLPPAAVNARTADGYAGKCAP